MHTHTETSRVFIHADNSDQAGGNHPRWRGDDNRELTAFPYLTEIGCDLNENSAVTAINSHLEGVLEKAPSDSIANLLVRKTASGFKAFLHIRSSKQKFKSFTRGRRLSDVVELAIRDVRAQIDKWKETRQLADN